MSRASLLLLAATAGCTAAAPVEAPPVTAGTVAPLPPSTPPLPVPPPPFASEVNMSGPEPALSATTGDPRLDAYRERVFREGGSAWRPYLLRAFEGVVANPQILEEGEMEPRDAAAYVERYVTPERIAAGQRLYAELNGRKLFEGEQKVPLEYLLALWGAMSDYGARPPRFDLIEVLANLGAYDRGPHWTEFNIYKAAQMLADGQVPRAKAKAYADGRMGQLRWFPEQYMSWGEDGDDDGQVDIWASRADILRNFHRSLAGAWEPGAPALVEIEPPPPEVIDPSGGRAMPRTSFGAHELRRADGRPWPTGSNRVGGEIMSPFGKDGPVYFFTRNFMPLNHQNPFAPRYADLDGKPGFGIAMALLADRIAGRPAPPRPPR